MHYEQFLIVHDVHTIKYHRCPFCYQSARLHVDIETDLIPQLDDEGHLQYYCLHCQETFSVETPTTSRS